MAKKHDKLPSIQSFKNEASQACAEFASDLST